MVFSKMDSPKVVERRFKVMSQYKYIGSITNEEIVRIEIISRAAQILAVVTNQRTIW